MTEPTAKARPAMPAQAMEEAVEWLILLQTPTPAQCQAFDAWLARDPTHADAYARASAAWADTAVGDAARELATPAPRLPRRRSRAWPAAVAAVVMLAVAAITQLPLRLQADHLTAIGERQRLNLDDGTQVLLNTESALSGSARTAHLLQGEAWFDVPGRATPLELKAGPLLARANGSAFSVRLSEGKARVQVERGEVDLQDSQHQRISLAAGMAVALDGSGFGQPIPLRPDEDLAWMHGRLVFVDKPLRQVLADLSRYYPGWIVDTRASLDDRRVTGNYSVENPVAVVRALAQVTSAKLTELPALMILN